MTNDNHNADGRRPNNVPGHAHSTARPHESPDESPIEDANENAGSPVTSDAAGDASHQRTAPTDADALPDGWMESLLVSATVSQDHSARIARAMAAIEDSSAALVTGPAKRWARLASWKTFCIAASLSLMIFLLLPGGPTPAMAAIERSLHVAAERMTRRYVLQVGYRTPLGTTRIIDSDLYVQGSDRFVLQHPGRLPGRATWLGRNGSESWVVPAIGPVLSGDETVLSRWLEKRGDLDSPYLHVTTILGRMKSRGFELQSLDDAPITTPDGQVVSCQHIRARRTVAATELPETIELWASRGTGMAIQLTAQWRLEPGQFGRESLLISYQSDEPNLPSDWFSADGHHRARRLSR